MHSSPELVTDTLLTPYFDSQCEPRNCTMFSTAFLMNEYYYRRRPGTIRPKCSFIETISSSENAFRKKWRAANVLTLSKLEGVLK